jgi:hypothetical protein
MGRIDGAMADGDGVIEHLADHTQGALGGFIGTALLDRAQHGQTVLVVTVIFAAFHGITGIDSVFREKTFLLITDDAGSLERNPGIGPDAQILSATFLGRREAMPPEPVLAASGVNLQEQASTVPEPPRTLWQSANFPVGSSKELNYTTTSVLSHHLHHHNFLLVWVLPGSHWTPPKQKIHCSAACLGQFWDITGNPRNPRFEP